jgi:hypothetical protein
MSLYMKIEEPKETKRSILVGKINTLNALKRIEEHVRVRRDMKKDLAGLSVMLKEVPGKVLEIKKCIPHVEVQKLSFTSGQLRCDVCGKSFKSEKGLKAHMTLHEDVEPSGAGVPKTRNELERLNREITILERQLNRV